MKGQPQLSFEEAIGNTCKLLGASIKTMLISAEVVIEVVTCLHSGISKSLER